MLKARPSWPLLCFYDALPCPAAVELWNAGPAATWVSVLLTQPSPRRVARTGRSGDGSYDASAHGLTDMSVLVCDAAAAGDRAMVVAAAALSGPAVSVHLELLLPARSRRLLLPFSLGAKSAGRCVLARRGNRNAPFELAPGASISTRVYVCELAHATDCSAGASWNTAAGCQSESAPNSRFQRVSKANIDKKPRRRPLPAAVLSLPKARPHRRRRRSSRCANSTACSS
eukprot:SAG22_NODE_607_length_8603_cov_4.554327_3_plen_229_part_00